ncbi:MAG TPA: glycogen debranching N-terminal domain-containing protein [Thermoanaerobaculia bacterium]|nr:glycogen debranching N-terminal domain-containing protein [Thermoanaerobaculia bacterium]
MSDSLIRLRPWPDILYVSQGRTVLATDRDGFFDGGSQRGLFVHQTRLVSRWRWLVDGRPWTPVALSNVDQGSWLGYYITLPPGADPGEQDQGSGHMKADSEQTLELRLSRSVGDGMREDADLTNFSQQTTRFTLAVEVDADFADLGETFEGEERQQKGELRRSWREQGELAFDYHAEYYAQQGQARIDRGLVIRIERAGSPPEWDEDGRISFQVELAPGAAWHCSLAFLPRISDLDGDIQGEAPAPRIDLFLEEAASFSTPESETLAPVVIGAMMQARRDLAALRLPDLDEGERSWTMAAGLPLYIALYGRDVLTASWQAALLGPEMMDGTLRALARRQGTVVDDWRDEQPGRMLHEAHTGPLAALGFNPRGRYYGSATTSGFYPVVVSELWHWTGDRERVRPLLGPALEALRWLERYASDGRNHNGFFDYRTRSAQGTVHQAWKDSPGAIVDEEGRQVEPPIATCEEQAFVYVARLHLSELLWWMGEKDEAKRLFHQAGELKKRFNDAFWMEDEGFIALGLDAQRRPIRSITSNPGHCLAAGIVDAELVERTAARLFEDDLWSGWGVRTLSSRNPAFNPYSYHRGSVWPVENGSFALGFLRYGLHDRLETVGRAMFEAARLFDHYRLPEVFSGHARDSAHPFPAIYPQANSPQAWSASAVICLVQALLGIYPYAPLKMLLVDPHLPEWLPELTVRGLRVGEASVDLRFFRGADGRSDWELLDQKGTLHVLRQPSPWSLTATFAERLRDILSSLLPGK